MSDHFIAGDKTPLDWATFRDSLLINPNKARWSQAYEEYFLTRIRLRYLDPVETLIIGGSYVGEGFSIMAILCSLIEFLESTYQGRQYKYLRKGTTPGPNEYSSSRLMFIEFLQTKEPFKTEFVEDLAAKFYENIRCGLLHEASTNDGWKIWGEHPQGAILDPKKKIVYRDGFKAGIDAYLAWYKSELETKPKIQNAFIRKFDRL